MSHCTKCGVSKARYCWDCGCPGGYCAGCVGAAKHPGLCAVGGGKDVDESVPWQDVLRTFQLRLDKLKAVTAENEQYLSMPKDVNFPIDRARLNSWVSEQGTENLRRLAGAVATSLVHVSFGEFKQRLLDVCKWAEAALETIKVERRETQVVPLLLLPGGDSFYKSNAWTTMIALHNDKLTALRGLICESTDAFLLQRRAERQGTKLTVVVVVVDDAVYTGTQMSINIRPSFSLLAKESVFTDAVQFLIAVPFIGTDAPRLIEYGRDYAVRRMRVRFPPTPTAVMVQKASVVVGPIYEQLTPAEKLAVTNRFGYSDMCSTMYFDHKMPDALSTMDKAMAFGEIIKKGNPLESSAPLVWFSDRNFISGCTTFPKSFPEPITALERDSRSRMADRGETCPPGFYKAAKYTFKGVLISTGTKVEDFFS